MAKNRHDEIFEYISKSDNKYLKEYTESESIDNLLDKLDEYEFLIKEYEFFNLNIEEKFYSYRLKVKRI